MADRFRKYWKESVGQVISKYGQNENKEISFRASVDCQVIRKSVVAYLGKYLSKGVELFKEIAKIEYEEYVPSQWWTANQTLKNKIKAGTIHIDTKMCQEYFYNFDWYLSQGIFTYFDFVTTDINGEERIIGCVGRMTFECYQLWLSTKT